MPTVSTLWHECSYLCGSRNSDGFVYKATVVLIEYNISRDWGTVQIHMSMLGTLQGLENGLTRET